MLLSENVGNNKVSEGFRLSRLKPIVKLDWAFPQGKSISVGLCHTAQPFHESRIKVAPTDDGLLFGWVIDVSCFWAVSAETRSGASGEFCMEEFVVLAGTAAAEMPVKDVVWTNVSAMGVTAVDETIWPESDRLGPERTNREAIAVSEREAR